MKSSTVRSNATRNIKVLTGVALLIAGVAGFLLWQLVDKAPDWAKQYRAAQARCGHSPYAAEETGGLGSGRYNLVTYSTEPDNMPLGFDGYFCSQYDAVRSGVNVVSVDGTPIK
jgi:hypothetical protein